MSKEFAKEFYKSKAWQKCRNAYISERVNIDGGLCEVCGKQPGHIVHHKVLITPSNINDSEITLNHKHLRYECKECHDREEAHAFIKQKALKCTFDVNGQPMPTEERKV